MDEMNNSIVKLRESTARLAYKEDVNVTAIDGLTIYRVSNPTPPTSGMFNPCICIAVQGVKRAVLENTEYVYDIQHYLITPINLPTIVQVVEATPEKPYIGLVLDLDLRALAELMLDGDLPQPEAQQSGHAMSTGRVSLELINAFQRLVDLIHTPRDIPILAPIIKREIFYRMLTGEQGARLRHMASVGSQGNRIARAIDWLRDNFSEPLRIDELASKVNMSTSTFHHHFKALTAMSPLQYQKWLRLNEARRLMLNDEHDATTAAMTVGYESPSQFSREYSRLFGAPPLRDISSLRNMSSQEVA